MHVGTQAHMQIFHQNRVVIDPRIHTKYQTGFNCLGWNYPPPPRAVTKTQNGKRNGTFEYGFIRKNTLSCVKDKFGIFVRIRITPFSH